jgi:hypothetical protein
MAVPKYARPIAGSPTPDLRVVLGGGPAAERLRKLLLLRALRRELHHAQSVRAGSNAISVQGVRK